MRMVEHMSSCMTQMHFDLLMDLFKMNTSHYTQVLYIHIVIVVICGHIQSLICKMYIYSYILYVAADIVYIGWLHTVDQD